MMKDKPVGGPKRLQPWADLDGAGIKCNRTRFSTLERDQAYNLLDNSKSV